MESFRDEKFTTRHKRHNPIPHSWLSSCGKIEIPHSRLRRSWGISISPRLLSHSWGIGISLLWLVVNFQFLHLRLRRSCRNYPVPETFHKWIGSFHTKLKSLNIPFCGRFLSNVNKTLLSMHFTQSIDWIKEIKSDFLLQLIYIVTVG